jgi:hypothetical protein
MLDHTGVLLDVLIGFLFIGILFIGVLYVCALLEDARRLKILEMAPNVRAFALQHFDEIDADHDGIITEGDMKQSIECFSGAERALLVHMQEHQSEVGHAISSFISTSTYLLPFGDVWVPHEQNAADYVYGISRDDLIGYPDRVTKKYKLAPTRQN